MLKILLELWWIETRRTFTWKKMGIFIYILFIMACFLIDFYVGGGRTVQEQMADLSIERFAVAMGLVVVLSDFMMKLMMKQDAAIMDDYLKSKPITERTWNKFLILSNLLDYWNYMVPLVMALIYFIFMPVGYALLATLMTYMLSVADGLAITCLHKADDWARKLAVWVGLLFYLFILTLYAFCFIGLGAVAHILGMMALSGLAIYVLCAQHGANVASEFGIPQPDTSQTTAPELDIRPRYYCSANLCAVLHIRWRQRGRPWFHGILYVFLRRFSVYHSGTVGIRRGSQLLSRADEQTRVGLSAAAQQVLFLYAHQSAGLPAARSRAADGQVEPGIPVQCRVVGHRYQSVAAANLPFFHPSRRLFVGFLQLSGSQYVYQCVFFRAVGADDWLCFCFCVAASRGGRMDYFACRYWPNCGSSTHHQACGRYVYGPAI